jgi:hypothetical protein
MFKKTVWSLNMSTVQGDRGKKKGIVTECVSSRKAAPLISNAHQVAEFQTYCIMNAGVNAGLGDQGMVRQHVFEKKLLTKFTENINSLGREYYALIALGLVVPSPPRVCVPWVLMLEARQPVFTLTNTSSVEASTPFVTVAFRPVVNMTNQGGTSTKYHQNALVGQVFQIL